jgi:hypothetical protein
MRLCTSCILAFGLGGAIVEGFFLPRVRPLDRPPLFDSIGGAEVIKSQGAPGNAAPGLGDAVRLSAATLAGPPKMKRLRVPSPEGQGSRTDLKLGVLLLQLGGPENKDDVEGFLYNLFADPGACAPTVVGCPYL